MILGIPLIGSFQNCGPNKLDFDVDQPALIIDAPVNLRPSEPSPGEGPSGDSSIGGDSASGGASGGTSDTDVASVDSRGRAASEEASSASESSSDSSGSTAGSEGSDSASEPEAEAAADKSDETDMNDGLLPEETTIAENSPVTNSKNDQRNHEKLNSICRVYIPNSKRVSTVKFKDGELNAKGINYRNRPYVACMSQFSCENLIGQKYSVKKAVKRSFCEKQSKKRVIHMTREDIMRYLGQ